MKDKPFITILLLFTLTGCGPTRRIETGGDWTGYHYSYFCPAYRFSDHAKRATQLSILNANPIWMADANCQTAVTKAKEYIKQRAGSDFLATVRFEDIDITYADSAERFKNKHPQYDLSKCGETKYYVRFLFHPQAHIDYCFGIALNAQFEMISTFDIPDKNKSPGFMHIIKPLEAYGIAKKEHKTLIKPLESIELTYDTALNYFVWEIEGKRKLIGRADYEVGMVNVNATTGKVIHSANIKGRRLINPSF